MLFGLYFSWLNRLSARAISESHGHPVLFGLIFYLLCGVFEPFHRCQTTTISQSAFGRSIENENVFPQQVLPEALPEGHILRRTLHPRRHLPASGEVLQCTDQPFLTS